MIFDLNYFPLFSMYIFNLFLMNVNIVDNVATLFRGTSAATTLMDQYMKMVAVPYVQVTLREVVIRIMECKQSCEVRIKKF